MVKKKETLMDLAKGSVKLGIVSGAGMGAVGAIGSIPGMPAATGNITGAVGAGLTLANVGQTAKIGLHIPKLMANDTSYNKRKVKKGVVDKILG